MSKVVLVTGAAKGIGKACVIAFAKEGYNVVINYLNSGKEALELESFVKETYGVKAMKIRADITDETAVINMMNKVAETFGSISVLINNAAYVCDNPYPDKTKEEFLRVLEVNVVGTFLVTKHALKHMNNGIIINVSSTDADDTYNELSMDYCASKAAVNSLTKTFSLAAPNNKFIAVMLPWVRTEAVAQMYPPFLESELKRTGQERLLETIEVADAFVKLVKDKDNVKDNVVRIRWQGR